MNDDDDRFVTVKFADKDLGRGFEVVVRAGQVAYTGKWDTFVVPGSSLKALQWTGIEFEVLPPSRSMAS